MELLSFILTRFMLESSFLQLLYFYPTISFHSSLEATFAALYESLGRSLTLYDASAGVLNLGGGVI